MFKDIKGNIAIAIVVILVAILSGVSLASVSFRDTSGFRLQLDGIQQFHLLRSEVGRGRLIAGHLESMTSPPRQNVLPRRSIDVQFGSHRTAYNANTRVEVLDMGTDEKGYLIRTLITASRGDSGDRLTDEHKSPVKRYGENTLRSLQTLALFHYFTDKDLYVVDTPGSIVFHEEDIIYGRVHSNTDIYMRQNSWPEFHGLVSTGGRLRVSGGGTNYPRDEIILGPEPGLIENHPTIAFEPSADRVRTHGRMLFGGNERDDAIAFVTVEGASYELRVGEIVTESDPPEEWIEGYNQFTIYDSYPPYGPVGDSAGYNRIPRTDTLWSEPALGRVVNSSVFVPMQLWISGEFAGRQTWASSHDIYLKDDLTYQGTPVGQRPDGIDEDGNQTLPVNTRDYLGIISEESIYIQYGHWSPADSMRHRPNTNDIYMYGAYCAVAESENPWEEGMVTIQYARPKGATPPQYNRGEFFWYIDLHLFDYPTTSSTPWPPGLDYPWYNPLWPEPGVILNVPGMPNWTPNPHNVPEVVEGRGDIWIFGSLNQRRRGAVGFPGPWHDTGIWDIHNEISPNTIPTYGRSAPNRVGYGKRYHTDERFKHTGPPHYPLIIMEDYDTGELMDLGYTTLRWIFKKPPSSF